MPQIPLMTGPQDPSQLEATINTLINQINSGVTGLVFANAAAVSTGTGTSEQTLQTAVVPAGTFTKVGQVLRLTATGTVATNGNNKTIQLKFGTIVLSSGVITSSNKVWKAIMEVMHTGTGTQTYTATYVDPTTGSVMGGGTGTVADSADVTCSLTGTDGTSSAGDITCNNFYAEIIK